MKDKSNHFKKIKEILERNEITRFNSIADIHDFIKNYDAEKNEITNTITKEFDSEIEQLHIDVSHYQKKYEHLKNNVKEEINSLKQTLYLSIGESGRSLFHKLFYHFKIKSLQEKKAILEENLKKYSARKQTLHRKNLLALSKN